MTDLEKTWNRHYAASCGELTHSDSETNRQNPMVAIMKKYLTFSILCLQSLVFCAKAEQHLITEAEPSLNDVAEGMNLGSSADHPRHGHGSEAVQGV
jgi:hypothetical protein